MSKLFFIAASRGRNPENPSDRRAGIHVEQRLEINKKGLTNTLTTVAKDNYVIEVDMGYEREKLCEELIKGGHVKPYDIIKHSYVKNRQKNMDRKESKNGLASCITSRADTLGVVVKDFSFATDKNGKPCINVKNNTKQGYLEAHAGDGVYTNISTKRGTVQKGIIQTLTTFQDKGAVVMEKQKLRIRKLTPLECFRLMGFDDIDYEKAHKVNSDAQLYKQCGNSIVVNCLERILENLIPKGEHIRILELFAGIGACSKALERLRIPHEIIDAVEIDKYAVKSFNAIHDTKFEPEDITKYDKTIKDIDLLVGGFPCQDVSIAGKQAGIVKGETRSGLMYEMLRLIKKYKPKYIITENVKNLLSKRHKPKFDEYIKTLERTGYNNFYQIMNAKDYGICQNRERVFIVSIRRDLYKSFKFPDKEELKIKLADVLEKKVDEKYYISKAFFDYVNRKVGKYDRHASYVDGQKMHKEGFARTLSTKQGRGALDNYIDEGEKNYV